MGFVAAAWSIGCLFGLFVLPNSRGTTLVSEYLEDWNGLSGTDSTGPR